MYPNFSRKTQSDEKLMYYKLFTFVILKKVKTES